MNRAIIATPALAAASGSWAQANSIQWYGVITSLIVGDQYNVHVRLGPSTAECGSGVDLELEQRWAREADAFVISEFELMYDNLPRALSEGSQVRLQIRQDKDPHGNTDCTIQLVQRFAND